MNNFPYIQADRSSLAQRTLIHGVATNDAWYKTTPTVDGKQVMCKYYAVWVNMIKRCYDPKCHQKQPTYTECSVVYKWLTFSNFRIWMEAQNWQVGALDKDLLIPGNKIYGPDTCVFVTSHTNSLLGNCAATRGKYPQGVCYIKRSSKYRAQITINGKTTYIGLFITPDEAGAAYKIAKANEIERMANIQDDSRVTRTLLLRADKLREGV